MASRRLLFLLRLIIVVHGSMNFTRINSAAYTPSNLINVTWYHGTCSECICFAFILNGSSTYQALNCYNNNTCLLFRNSFIRSNVRINRNSIVYYPSISTYTTAATCINVHGQCGGSAWAGSTNCCAGLSCIYQNSSYSQCSLTTTMSPVPATTMSYFNASLPNATIGLYWGCCKPSCGWPGKASFTNPPQTCQPDGVTPIDPNTQSICNSGTASMCSNQQPWNVSNNLSYGFVGANIVNQGESFWCGACYSLVFISGPITGKQMIVQVVNTAYVSYDTFIIQVPGGGWGSGANGCALQFNNTNSSVWGPAADGITNRSGCANLPINLQAGCYWRFDWFNNANNSTVQFTEVQCPSVLANMTGCTRY